MTWIDVCSVARICRGIALAEDALRRMQSVRMITETVRMEVRDGTV